MKCVLIINGRTRYTGSVTTVVNTINSFPPGYGERSTYSATVALSLYGTPFLRKYPAFILSVATFKERLGMSHSAIERPCQGGSVGGGGGTKWSKPFFLPATASIRGVLSSSHGRRN